MAPWVAGGPCANPRCKKTMAAAWSGGVDGPQYCHLRACRRLGGYLPPLGRGRDRSQDEQDNPDADMVEVCTEIEAIVGLAYDKPNQRLSKKQRRNVPSSNSPWFDVVGTFADAEDEDDRGSTDRRWLQMEDLGHVSKSDIKDAITAYEEEAKKAVKKALT